MFLHHPLAATACPWWKLARFAKVKQQIFLAKLSRFLSRTSGAI
jgi:hypothetical protein